MNPLPTLFNGKTIDSATQEILNYISDGILTHYYSIHDDYIQYGKCLYVNNAMIALCGMERIELFKKNPPIIFTPDFESWYEHALRDFRSKDSVVFQTAIIDKEGSRTAVDVKLFLNEHDDELLSTCIISKRPQEPVAIKIPDKEKVSALSSDNQMTTLNTLISGIAHEINNPNNIIALSTDLVKDIWGSVCEYIESTESDRDEIVIHGQKIDTLNKNIRDILDNIINGSERINKTISAIRDFIRIDSDETMTDCNITAIIKSSFLLCDDLIKKHTDNFYVHYDTDIPHSKAYLRLMQKAIVNCIHNACEALTERSQKITLSVTYQKTSNTVSVCIEDEGQGIAPENLTLIYNPFFTTRRSSGHLGLGLSVVHAIMQKHKGTIAINSTHGFGTTVTLQLPAVIPLLHQTSI